MNLNVASPGLISILFANCRYRLGHRLQRQAFWFIFVPLQAMTAAENHSGVFYVKPGCFEGTFSKAVASCNSPSHENHAHAPFHESHEGRFLSYSFFLFLFFFLFEKNCDIDPHAHCTIVSNQNVLSSRNIRTRSKRSQEFPQMMAVLSTIINSLSAKSTLIKSREDRERSWLCWTLQTIGGVHVWLVIGGSGIKKKFYSITPYL